MEGLRGGEKGGRREGRMDGEEERREDGEGQNRPAPQPNALVPRQEKKNVANPAVVPSSSLCAVDDSWRNCQSMK